MSEGIEDRLRRAAHDLQMKPASPRSTPRSGHRQGHDSMQRRTPQTPQLGYATSTNMPPTKKRHVAKYAQPKLVIVAAVVVLLGAGVYVLFASGDSARPDSTPKLPAAITGQISDFTPYFFRGAAPQGFNFNTKNISYSAGVLFLQGQDAAGNSVVISEQALPNDFANSKPQGDQAVNNVNGNGAISNREGRTIGTLITSKSPQTLISVNAAETVHASTIEALMAKLVPLPGNR